MSRSVEQGRGREATRPSEVPRRGWIDIGKRVMAEVKNDHIPVVAAGCAFYAWVALIPALIALITVYGLVASPQQVADHINQLTSGVSPEATEVIRQPVESATQTTGRALSIGLIVSLVVALWSASGGMDGLIKGINIAYDEPPRSFARRRGLALLLTFGAIIFVVLAVGLIAGVPIALNWLGLGEVAQIGGTVASYVLLLLLGLLSLGVLYKVAPHRDNPRFRWVAPGTLIAAVLWLIGSVAFSIYVNNFGNYNQTYGALGGVIILNLWLFLTMYVVLLGAEINSETEHQTRKDSTVGEPQPMGQRDATKADHLGEAAR